VELAPTRDQSDGGTASLALPDKPRTLGVTSLQILGAIRYGIAYGLDIVSQTGMPSGTVCPTPESLKKSGLLRAGSGRTTGCLVTVFGVLAIRAARLSAGGGAFLRDQE
jgi:hypothetical protein